LVECFYLKDIKGGKSGKRKYPSAKEYEKIMRQTWSEIVPAELVQSTSSFPILKFIHILFFIITIIIIIFVPAMPEKEVQRQERLYELLKTEREYVNDLDVIIEVFLKPIASRKLVTVKDLGILFSNVEQLLTIHQELLRLLELQHENSKVIVDVGPAFDKTVCIFVALVSINLFSFFFPPLRWSTLRCTRSTAVTTRLLCSSTKT